MQHPRLDDCLRRRADDAIFSGHRQGRSRRLKNLPPGQYTVAGLAAVAQGRAGKIRATCGSCGGERERVGLHSGLEAGLPRQARARLIARRLSLKFRFRSFRSRLLFFLVALLTLLQTATYLLVRQANRQHALAQIESSLRTGARIFEKLIEQRNQQITATAAILSRDHAFQEAFAGADEDRATTFSALESLQGRVKADAVLIASLDKELLFDMRRPELHGVPFPFPKLIDKAETNDSAYAFVFSIIELYAMAVTPLLAPDPIAWLCLGFRIDDDFAREIKTYTDLEITFLNGPNSSAPPSMKSGASH